MKIYHIIFKDKKESLRVVVADPKTFFEDMASAMAAGGMSIYIGHDESFIVRADEIIGIGEDTR